MLTYLVIFTAIGFAIGHFSKEKKTSLIAILVISVLWGMSHQAIWGLATLGELMLGYFIYDVIEEKKIEVNEGDKNG
jgi:hypothetical protein